MKEDLRVAILDLDLNEVRRLLSEADPEKYFTQEKGDCILHELIDDVSTEVLLSSPHRRRLIYMLTNAGLDVNETDKDGNTALHLCIDQLNGDQEICEPLLQAGAEVLIKNKDGFDVAQKVKENKVLSDKSRAIFNKYHFGLWNAVEADSLLQVRKLVNLWCRVDIKKDGKTLKELALEKGTEHIIHIIIEIAASMALAHCVLAEDVKLVRKLLTDGKERNLEFRNLGDMGATPLYYAITYNNAELVGLLVSRGAKLDAVINMEDEEMPILFTAFASDKDVDLIKQLVPDKEKNGFSLVHQHYKGHFVLHYCIEKRVPLTAVRHILHQGYSELVALRDSHNRCPRDLAMTLGLHDYVKIIDECVHDWCLDNDTNHRRTLALMGYSHLLEAGKDGVRACDVIQTMETSSEQAQFDTQLILYQEQTAKLAMAIENGDLESVKNLMYFETNHADSFHTCLAHGKPKGDGQPLLHKAILQGHLDIIEYMANVIVHTLKMKLDDLRDQGLRTALHYAYAMENGKPLFNCLLDYGASEFTMDKDGRSPLAFRDLRKHPEMAKLIEWHRLQKYDSNEPDPWKVKMPKNRGPSFGRGGKPQAPDGRVGNQNNQLGYGTNRTFPRGQPPGLQQWPPGMSHTMHPPPGSYQQNSCNSQAGHSHGPHGGCSPGRPNNWPPGQPSNWPPGQPPNWAPGQPPYWSQGPPPNWSPGQQPNWSGQPPNWSGGPQSYWPPGPPNWPAGPPPPNWLPGQYHDPGQTTGQSQNAPYPGQNGNQASGRSPNKNWSYWDYCSIS